MNAKPLITGHQRRSEPEFVVAFFWRFAKRRGALGKLQTDVVDGSSKKEQCVAHQLK
jgi:hypothetical protein